MAGRGAVRDPASVLLDSAARQILEHAYRDPGNWHVTRLAYPSPRLAAELHGMGIDPHAADDASAAGRGGLNARDRWMRALVRALYYQHKWYSSAAPGRWRHERRAVPRETGALRVEPGRRLPALGVIPAGRRIGVMLATGGAPSMKAVGRLAERDRIYDNTGDTAGRWSDPGRRDWSLGERRGRALVELRR